MCVVAPSVSGGRTSKSSEYVRPVSIVPRSARNALPDTNAGSGNRTRAGR